MTKLILPSNVHLHPEGPRSRDHLFDPLNPKLQVKWDASTLKDFMFCEHYYQRSHLEGWTTKATKVDLDWGSAYGRGQEVFVDQIISGDDHETALVHALRATLEASWDRSNGRPFLGSYEEVWRCTGSKPYKNQKGNKAKCPWSHKGKLFPAPGPETCGQCGSPTETYTHWFPDDPTGRKDRVNLLRAIVWKSDDYRTGGIRPVSVLVDGKELPLTELHWEMPFATIDGTKFTLSGNTDNIVKLSGDDGEPFEVFILDYKSTKNHLSDDYFSTFAPNVQVDLYDLAHHKIIPPSLRDKYSGIMIDAVQVLKSGVRFEARVFKNDASQRGEYTRELITRLTAAKKFAQENYWPKNRASCWKCDFKKVCAAPKDEREALLRKNFIKAWWNPTTRRRETLTEAEPAPTSKASEMPTEENDE